MRWYQLIIAVFGLTVLESGLSDTVAKQAWQSSAENQCAGNYLLPDTETKSENNVTTATARDALHVIDHSTTFTGDVTIINGQQKLTADFATIDEATDNFGAESNVVLVQPGFMIQGERISGNLFNNSIAVDSASFLLHQNHIRGRADNIEKSGDQVTIKSGEFTTCPPNSNTWLVEGETIDLKPAEGYGIARDVTLKIKDLPVAYFPYLRFPIGDKRQSGFLLPSIGHDSDGGTDIAAPYYFNIAPNLDATYTLRSIWKRGLMHEGEVRYLNGYGENLLAATFLPSDDIYDARTVITPGSDFDKEDRWLTHFRHRGKSGPWSSSVNFTQVSDIDYLHDLGGFSSTSTQFDRTLGSNSAPALLRTGWLSYRKNNWQTRLDLRSFQELNQTQPPQYEVLPQISLSGQEYLGPVRTTVGLQATEFEKSGSVDPTGTRAVADLKLELPFNRPWGYVVPGLRTIYRDYNLDGDTLLFDENASITTTTATLDAGLVFEREINWGDRQMIQTLEPRLHYLYVEDEFQGDIPSFDSTPLTPSYDAMFRDNRYTGYDRIGDADRVAIGLSSSFLELASGRNVLNLQVGQLFHFADREVNFGQAPGVDPTADASPIFFGLQADIGKTRILASYEHDTEENRSNRGFLAVKYRHSNGALFNFTYAMTDESVQRNRLPRNEEESDVSFLWPINNKWRFIGRWNYGWDNSQTIESLLGVEYNDCCWKARLVYRRNLDEPRFLAINTPGMPVQFVEDRRADSGIYFEFQLKGLGSLGGRLDSMLNDSLLGYSEYSD